MRRHVLFLYENFSAPLELAYKVFKSLEEIYGFQLKTAPYRYISNCDIEWSDIVVTNRSTCTLAAQVAERCKLSGCFIIEVIDDNLFSHRRTDWYMRRRQSSLQKVLDSADVIFSPNLLLADYLLSRSKAKRVAVVDSLVDSQLIQTFTEKTDYSEFRIIYYSNDGSYGYFSDALMNALESIRGNKYKAISIDLIGIERIPFSSGHIEVNFVPHMSLSDFRKYLANGHYDVGLAPLNPNDGYSQYKYFNKFIEFSLAGVVGIYSNCPPNIYVVKNGVNGFLVDNSLESWITALKKVMEDDLLRHSCVINAQNTLRTRHSIEVISKQIVEQVPEFLTYFSNRKKITSLFIPKTFYWVFTLMEKFNAVFRILKFRGLNGVIKRIYTYLLTQKQNKVEEKKKDYNEIS